MALATKHPEIEDLENQLTARRWALVVEYDGTHYYGFQLQANRPTIQSELEKALKKLTGDTVRVAAASRTDTGVHALAQVASFKTNATLPPEAFVHGLNYYLPGDIAIKAAYQVKLDFSARLMASSREYSYTIITSATRSPLADRHTYRINGEPSIELMNQACRMLLGTHDFSSFASDIGHEPEKSTVRHVYRADVVKKDNSIIFTIIGNSFLRHQVRSTAGLLLQIGFAKINLNEFESIVEAKRPGLAGPTLPASGLKLVKVNYPLTFEEMK